MSDQNFAEGIELEQGGAFKRFREKFSAKPSRTKLIMMASIITLLILTSVLLIIIITFEVKANKNVCDLSENRPPMERAKYLKSDDNRALVSFSGYIKYELEDTNEVFAPFSLKHVEAQTLNDGTNLRLMAGCADFEMRVVNLGGSQVISEVHVDLARYGLHSNKCTLDFRVNINSSDHFVCDRSIPFYCQKDDILIAQVTINRFEYELDGDPDKVARYEFSTEAEYC